jgi:hypothetical protein
MRKARSFLRATVVVACAVLLALVLVGATGPLAGGDIYRPGSTGYDVSYPQCGQAAPTNDFAIVGITHGRPFRYNDCLGAQVRHAPKTTLPSVYLNTGYDLFYDRWLTKECISQAPSRDLSVDERRAWAIGCSESASASDEVRRQGAGAPSIWWLDVETDNSWSHKTELNRATIQGAVDYLYGSGRAVGIYSNSRWWQAITGGDWAPSGVTADWVGTVKKPAAASFCGLGFSYHPVWLVQYIEDDFDRDYVCE